MAKKIKFSSLLLITATMILLTISGCASKSKDATTNSPASTTKATAAATAAPKDNGVMKKITYYGFSEWVADPKIAPVFQELKKQFESENPGFEVEFQSDPWETWEPKYKVMFASGNPTDVFIVNNPDFPTFANGGYLLDIGQTTGADYFKDFFPGVLSMYKWSGKNMAIPFTTDARVLWYNKEIFKKAGLDPEKPPTTWNELKDDALKITKATNGQVYGYGMDLGLQEFPAQSLFTASDSNVITVGDDGKVTPNVNTPVFKDYLKLLADMKPAYEPDFAALDHHKVGTLFAQQKVAMVIAGTWVSDQNENMKDAKFYGQALVPKYNESAPNGSFGGGFGIGVSAKTKYPEQAIKLAQMMASAKFNPGIVTDVPANNAALAESKFAKDPTFKVFMDQIKYARQSQPKTLYYSKIDKAIYDSASKVILGGSAVDQEVSNLEKKITEAAK